MTQATPATDTDSEGVLPLFYTADEVACITRLAKATVYEVSRLDPDSIGAVRFGRRAVRFRRSVIDRLAGCVEGTRA